MIYRLAERADWRAAQTSGLFLSVDLGIEGFIHASKAEQVAGVAQRYYAGRADLILLEIQEEPLGPSLRWEASTGGESFPHVYGPIPLMAISRVASFPEVQPSGDASSDASVKLVRSLPWQPWPPVDLSSAGFAVPSPENAGEA